MAGDFDIQALRNFRPAGHLCVKCLALLKSWPIPRQKVPPSCPVCGVQYLPTDAYNPYEVNTFLASRGCQLTVEGLLEHCSVLASATMSTPFGETKSPMRTLLEVISRARLFVHFVSFGISDFFVGALKLAAQRIPVRGIVANVDERILDELTAFTDEVPSGRLVVHHFLREGAWREAPHQKLVVVDGLVAFKGSANLTTSGWRKAAKGLDHVEIMTSVGEVIDLHNRLFSPVWAERSGIGDAIEMAPGF